MQTQTKLEYQRAYRAANKATIRAYQKEYRQRRKQANPNYMAEYMRSWRRGQKKYDLALYKLMHLYTCDRLTIEAVKEILQPICEMQTGSVVPDHNGGGA